MTKHTERLAPLPAGSIDFNKVHSAAKQGKKDPFAGAVSKQRDVADEVDKAEANANRTQAEEAGLVVDETTGGVVAPVEVTE